MSAVAIGSAVAGAVVSSALAPSGSGSGSGSGQAAAAADPFASQRGQYQSMLQQMMTGGGTAATPGTPAVAATPGHWGMSDNVGGDGQNAVAQWIAGTPGTAATPGTPGTASSGFTPQDPSYQFRYQQGLDATNAGSAASGMLNSGNRLLALQTYGQGQASTEYANQFSRLSQLAGANVGSPAAAGQLIQQGNLANQQAAGAVGNAVGKAVTGWGNQLASGGSTSTAGGMDLGGGVTVQSDTNTYNPGW